MSAALGAALKKIAVSLLSDPKILKKVLAVVLVLIVAFFTPIMLIYGIFSGEIKLDQDKLHTLVMDTLTEEETKHLQQLRTTMDAIEGKMTEDGYTPYNIREAQVLYALALYPKEQEGNFVGRLTSCFAQEQTVDQLIAAVNTEFGTSINTEDFKKLMATAQGEIVAVALTQLGNSGGQPYWSWYGVNVRIEWCACFVSWCADQCGYLDLGVVPKFASCTAGMNWFKDKDQWKANDYIPASGDLIFFDWAKNGQNGSPDHVGIVERVEDGTVYTVEGNSGDAVRQRSYPVGYYEILGYATPAYSTPKNEA